MMEFLKSRVSAGLGISFVCLFCSIYLSLGYHAISDYLSSNYGAGYEQIYVSK